jgi:hypothetical protein
MILCPSCNHTELSGALFCSKCGAQLVHIAGENTNNIRTASIEDFARIEIPTFPEPPIDAPDSRVALLVLDSEEVIHIRGEDEFTLGRSTKGQTIIPDIDLSPFQAYEAGVSRLHANINIAVSNITLKDLGSANGTRLNGLRIEPHQEQILKNGDILTFGKLKIQVLIHD